MRWLGRSRVAWAVALAIAGDAPGAQIVFDPVEAPAWEAGSDCPAPCFNVHMYFEDPTRSVAIQSLQFDIEITSGGAPAILPVPPQSSAQADGGNPELKIWDLSSAVGKSPNAGFDALVVNAAARPFTLNSVQAQFDASCAGGLCPFTEAALASNRIYLGRFNATLSGTAPSFRIGGIHGDGQVIAELRNLYTPGWDQELPPPLEFPAAPEAPSPGPLAPPPPVEPWLDPPVEEPPDVPYDGPVNLDWDWCRGCELRCQEEFCVHVPYDRRVAILHYPHYRTTNARSDAVPEARAALLAPIGVLLLALRRRIHRG